MLPALLATADEVARPEQIDERAPRRHSPQNWFFMDSGVGPAGILLIQ